MQFSSGIKNSTYWGIVSSTPLKVKRHFEGTSHLHRQGRRISKTRNQHETASKLSSVSFMPTSCLSHSLTLKMETTCPPNFQQTTWHYNPEDRPHHNHCCENLRSYINGVICLWRLTALVQDKAPRDIKSRWKQLEQHSVISHKNQYNISQELHIPSSTVRKILRKCLKIFLMRTEADGFHPKLCSVMKPLSIYPEMLTNIIWKSRRTKILMQE
jgi:hypothetical protein